MIQLTVPEQAWQDVEPGTEALVDQWLVGEGDRVAAAQVVAKVVLVKTTLEIAAPVDGVVERIFVPAEQTVARGKPLGLLREG